MKMRHRKEQPQEKCINSITQKRSKDAGKIKVWLGKFTILLRKFLLKPPTFSLIFFFTIEHKRKVNVLSFFFPSPERKLAILHNKKKKKRAMQYYQV